MIKAVIRDSNADFTSIVWPAMRRALGGGEIIPVETVAESGFAHKLDMEAGIDAWQRFEYNGIAAMRGLAVRVQWGCAWRSFTVRYTLSSGYNTEYQKRLLAIEKDIGALYPHITIQAYLDKKNGRLLCAMAVKTADLISIAKGIVNNSLPCTAGGMRTNRTDGNQFIFVNWDYIRQSGYESLLIDDKPRQLFL